LTKKFCEKFFPLARFNILGGKWSLSCKEKRKG
jgi:hypothetical protein